MALNPAITNLLVVFGIMQIANKFNLDHEGNTMYLRAAYLGMQAITFALLYIIYQKVSRKNDQTPLTYTEAKNPMEPQNVDTIRTTVKDYDITKLKETARGQLIAMALIGFMHYKWGYLRPLLLQSILGLRTIYQAPLVQVHILGKPAQSELARPWKAASPFGQNAKPITEKELKAKEKKEAKKKLSHQD